MVAVPTVVGAEEVLGESLLSGQVVLDGELVQSIEVGGIASTWMRLTDRVLWVGSGEVEIRTSGSELGRADNLAGGGIGVRRASGEAWTAKLSIVKPGAMVSGAVVGIGAEIDSSTRGWAAVTHGGDTSWYSYTAAPVIVRQTLDWRSNQGAYEYRDSSGGWVVGPATSWSSHVDDGVRVVVGGSAIAHTVRTVGNSTVGYSGVWINGVAEPLDEGRGPCLEVLVSGLDAVHLSCGGFRIDTADGTYAHTSEVEVQFRWLRPLELFIPGGYYWKVNGDRRATGITSEVSVNASNGWRLESSMIQTLSGFMAIGLNRDDGAVMVTGSNGGLCGSVKSSSWCVDVDGVSRHEVLPDRVISPELVRPEMANVGGGFPLIVEEAKPECSSTFGCLSENMKRAGRLLLTIGAVVVVVAFVRRRVAWLGVVISIVLMWAGDGVDIYPFWLAVTGSIVHLVGIMPMVLPRSVE